jgi:hypothetical protein
MANSKTTLWLWRPTPSDPTAKLGFYTVLKSAAQALVDGGYAQWPKIGAYRFNRMNKLATTIALGMKCETPTVEEGGIINYRIMLAEAINAPVTVNITREAASTAISGTDYAAIPASVVIPANNDFFILPVTTIDRSGVQGDRTLVLKATGTHAAVTGTPTATATITDGA